MRMAITTLHTLYMNTPFLSENIYIYITPSTTKNRNEKPTPIAYYVLPGMVVCIAFFCLPVICSSLGKV